MNSRTKFLIIGSGPTGLGAAYRLKALGQEDYQIFERNDYIGGLATSFVDEKGFTWDIGGHVQFSHYKYFDEAMELALSKDGWLHHLRESWVWMKERFVPYPFQNNIRYLPKESMWECIKGVIDANANKIEKPANFKEWIMATFGHGIANEFMVPYNYKVWAYPPEDMAYQWIGERVAVVDLKKVLENVIFEKEDVSWGPNNMFQFPKEGGTGAIWNSVARRVGLDKIRLNSEVKAIHPAERTVELANGDTVSYDYLLSTMPLDVLTTKVESLDPDVVKRAQGLKHSCSNIIGIGIEGTPREDLATKCWMYFPEENCPFYRMTVFSNYSPKNVPNITNQYSLMCEVSESPKKEVDRTQLIEQTIQGLRANNLLAPGNEIVSKWMYTADYGYPTPSLERDDILRDVIPVLDEMGVFSRGRFGGWKYEVSNQDHSFMQGVEWTNMICDKEPEVTFRVDGTGRTY